LSPAALSRGSRLLALTGAYPAVFPAVARAPSSRQRRRVVRESVRSSIARRAPARIERDQVSVRLHPHHSRAPLREETCHAEVFTILHPEVPRAARPRRMACETRLDKQLVIQPARLGRLSGAMSRAGAPPGSAPARCVAEV